MQQLALKASYRTGIGYGPAKRLRSEGQVPGIVYGVHTKPVNVQVQSRELGKVLGSSLSENVLVELEVSDGAKAEKRLALVREVQHDAISGQVLHVDFHELKADEKFTAAVPVEPFGESIGVKNGGVLEISMHRLHVRCLPKDLPAKLVLDVTKLEIGKAIHVSEITPPADVELLDRKDLPVIAIVAPQVEEEVATTVEGGAAAEPEVIKEKKAEGEEAAAEGEKGKKGEAKPAAGKEAAKPEAKAEAKKK